MRDILRDPEKNSLIISEDQEGAFLDKPDFREKMLINNHIEGILGLKVYNVNNRKIYEYDTSGLETLEAFCKRQQINKEIVKKLFEGLSDTLILGGKYLLEENDFVLSPEYLFLDSNFRPFIAYCPDYGKTISEQFGGLSEYLMNRIDYHDKDAVLLTYTAYMKSREEGFSIGEVKKYLKEALSENEKKTKHKTDLPMPAEHENEIREIYPDPSGMNFFKSSERIFDQSEVKALYVSNPKSAEKSGEKRHSLKKGFAGKNADKAIRNKNVVYIVLMILAVGLVAVAAYKAGLIVSKNGKVDPVKLLGLVIAGAGIGAYVLKRKTSLLKTGGNYEQKEELPLEQTELLGVNGFTEEATELLSKGSGGSGEIKYRLVSDEFPDIILTHFPFYIGKDEKSMDYCLNYSGVSRKHAKFDRLGAGIEVSDLNSTNGTYVNDIRVEPGRSVGVNAGDKLEIGVCTYFLHTAE